MRKNIFVSLHFLCGGVQSFCLQHYIYPSVVVHEIEDGARL